MIRIGRFCDFCGLKVNKHKSKSILRLCDSCRIKFYNESLINWKVIREDGFNYG